MAIDFTKPATTDNHATAFVPGILAHQIALAQWLDSGLTTINGTPPTGAKQYNRTSSGLQEWSGSSWVPIKLQGIELSAGKLLIGGATATGAVNVLAAASTIYGTFDAPTAAYAYHLYAQGGSVFGYMGQASGILTGGANTDMALRANGNLKLAAGGGVPVVHVLSNGRVGIGFSPISSAANAADLQIGDPTNSGGSGLTLGATITSDIAFSRATSGAGQYAGMIRYSHANDSLQGWTASTERWRTTGAGDFGLGTATPNKLAVTRALTVNGSADSAFEVAAGDVSCGWLFGSPSRVTLETNGAIPLTFNVNGAQRLEINTSGLVTAAVGFAGPGGGLTALNASALASGTVPNARTTGTAAATASTLALRDANGDSAVRALTLGNTAVAGNVLNWFEKDVPFTPVVLFNGAAATGWVFTIAGRYTRIGNCVHFRFSIVVGTVGSATGDVSLQVASFPYAPASISNVTQFADLQASFSTGLSAGGLRLLMGSSSVLLYNWQAATGNNVAITNSHMTAGSQWHGSGFYFV